MDERAPSNPSAGGDAAALQKAYPGLSAELAQALARAEGSRKQGLFPVARQQLEVLLKQHPNLPVLRREQILLHLAAEEHERAEPLLLAEAQRVPGDRWVWMTLGLVRFHSGNRPGETEALMRALALKAEETPARRLFELQRDEGDMRGALDTVVLLRRIRDTDELAVAHCKLLVRVDRPAEAMALCEQLMQRSPVLAGAVEQWTSLQMSQFNGPEQVLATMGAFLAQGREEPPFLIAYSRACHRMERNAEAIEALQKALARESGRQQWWYDLAVLQRQMGQIAESQASFEQVMALDPLDPTTLRVHGVEHKYAYGDTALRHINQALASMEAYAKERQVELHYAAAKAYEDVGELDAAFDHYRIGGAKQTALTPYRHAAASGLLRTLRIGMRPQTYASFQEPGDPSRKPVFVLGMPRSGTTLAEQIIASHPQAVGAGELKLLHRVLDGISVNGNRIQTSGDAGVIPTYIPGVDLNCATLRFRERGERYVQAISVLAEAAGRGDAQRVVDKMPGNYFWTGMIPFVLPGARIIHTRRHPMDCCLSNYRIFFPDGMPWSYDLRNLGKCYRAYHEHMQHWESNMPPGMLMSVVYEEVVADLEASARRIIDHIGLPWDDACLRFYETERPVKTASLSQVRQPIYNSSVGRWRKYEKYLKPLLAEIGPIVESYEAELQRLSQARQAAPGAATS
ncbi:tetratricopeptide repeat-containing sulfotransferase family protein [Azohydromonas lata]|uniref:tetratricopeptide repeat-containing sulfotransferase family protein n=1 Tax=Azohydromonas lata TaxID=45677 RepID=UPI000830A351|nr:tetratricopeptide repeat-containing sulfotransferase family protein [Azohydromonas lata]